MKNKKLIIIGSGFGAISVLFNLKKFFGKRQKIDILLISKSNGFLFTPLLHELATGEVSATNIFYPLEKLKIELGNFDFKVAEVENINFQTKNLFTSDSAYTYDYLVIASGSETNFYNNKNILENAYTLKNIDDSLKIRNTLSKAFLKLEKEAFKNTSYHITIVGGGATGVELIASINDFISDWKRKHNLENNISLTLIESSNKILAELNSEELSLSALKRLSDISIDVKLLGNVEDFSNNNLKIFDKATKSTYYLKTDFFVWTAGVKPSKLITNLELEKDEKGKIFVDDYLNIINNTDVYALGDCCSVLNNGYPATAQVALQQGEIIAHNIFSKTTLFSYSKKFKYFHQGSLISIGKGFAISDVMGIKFTGFLGWFIWKFIHLVKLSNNKSRINVFLDWLITLNKKRYGI